MSNFQKPESMENGREQMESNAKRRRISGSSDKRRKKRKEPRPHPSYRLNKRYWDDIRAGRRPRSATSTAVFNVQHPPELLSGISCGTASTTSVSYFPLSFFTPPAATTGTVMSPPGIPYPFLPTCTPFTSPVMSTFNSKTLPHSETDATIDVTTVDDKEKYNRKASLVEEKRHQSNNGLTMLVSANTDDCIDEIADKLMVERISAPRRRTAQTIPAPLPVPVPIVIPVLLPVSEQFILKHFSS